MPLARSATTTCAFVAGAVGLLAATDAAATDCTPATGSSTCIDANSLWLRPTDNRFVAVGTNVPRAGTGVLTAHTGYLYRPIVVEAPSPDPSGRDILVAEHVSGVSLGGTYTPIERLGVGLSLPFVLLQSGTGLAGITARSGPGPSSPVLRDSRLHAAFAILEPGSAGVGVVVGADLSVPLGAEGSFAGGRGLSGGPFAALQGTGPWWFWGVELGARLQPEVPLAGLRLGHQGVLTAGAGLQTTDDALGLAGELWARPSWITTERTTPSAERVDEWPVGAEWMLSGWARFGGPLPGSVQLGVGGAIPLGLRTVDPVSGASRSELFTAPGSPAFRALLGVRFPLPLGRDTSQ